MRPFVTILIAVLLSVAANVLLLRPTTHTTTTTKEAAFDRVIRTNTLRCGYFYWDSLLRQDFKTGEMSGPAYDITMAMAQNLGLKVEWVQEAGFIAIGDDLNNGRYDMLCVPFGPTGNRGRVMEMSDTVFYQPNMIVMRKDHPQFHNPDPSWLNNEKTKFIAIDGAIFSKIIRNYFPNASIISLPELSGMGDMFQEVANKKADALIISRYDTEQFSTHNPDLVDIYAYRGDLSRIPYRFAFPKGDTRLSSMMNMALQELSYSGTIDSILHKYDPGGIYYIRP